MLTDDNYHQTNTGGSCLPILWVNIFYVLKITSKFYFTSSTCLQVIGILHIIHFDFRCYLFDNTFISQFMRCTVDQSAQWFFYWLATSSKYFILLLRVLCVGQWWLLRMQKSVANGNLYSCVINIFWGNKKHEHEKFIASKCKRNECVVNHVLTAIVLGGWQWKW